MAQIARLLAVPALVRRVLAIQVHNMVVAQLRQLLEALPTLGTREVPFFTVDACMILELEGAKRSVATLVTPAFRDTDTQASQTVAMLREKK